MKKTTAQTIAEEFPEYTGKSRSRQRLWQLRNERRLLCIQCSAPVKRGRQGRCDSCYLKLLVCRREAQRLTKGLVSRYLKSKSYMLEKAEKEHMNETETV